MTVKFYSVSINPIVLNKTLGTATDKTCTIKDNMDIINPVVELAYDAAILGKNYMYISDLGRYYFITNIEIVGHRIFVTGHVDVLKTYNSQIRAGNCTSTRSNFYNKNIPDALYLPVPQDKITYRKLSSALSGDTYICIIGG